MSSLSVVITLVQSLTLDQGFKRSLTKYSNSAVYLYMQR